MQTRCREKFKLLENRMDILETKNSSLEVKKVEPIIGNRYKFYDKAKPELYVVGFLSNISPSEEYPYDIKVEPRYDTVEEVEE